MTANTTSTPLDWVDPDDAPELDARFFDDAEVRIGDRVVRAATAGRDEPPQPPAEPDASQAPAEPETPEPPPEAREPASAAPVRKPPTAKGQVLARLKEAIGLQEPPVAGTAAAGDASPLYSALVQELAAAASEGALRQWALATADRRAMLSATERGMLRSEVAAKQEWLEEQATKGDGR